MNKDLTEPTREQKCADLARAMFPGAIEIYSGQFTTDTGVEVCLPIPAQQHGERWIKFDPFTSADDSRALVEWLATQSVNLQDEFDAQLMELQKDHPDDLRSLSLWYLTAPLPVIAEAAWRAIAAEPPTTSHDLASPSLPPTS